MHFTVIQGMENCVVSCSSTLICFRFFIENVMPL